MSDDADQFYNAWVDVFGDGPKKLLCTWHVDKNWKEALHKHIPGDAALQNKVQLHFHVPTVRCLLYHVYFQYYAFFVLFCLACIPLYKLNGSIKPN